MTKNATETQAPALAQAVQKDRAFDNVLIKLTRDRNEGRGLYVNVNDRNWFIPRGVTVTVPRYIAEVVERSAFQDERTQLLIDELSAKSDRF